MIHFVGAGPGAPDLITVRGQRLLQEADQVIYAGSLVNPELLKLTKKDAGFITVVMTLEEVLFQMQEEKKKGWMTSPPAYRGSVLVWSGQEQMDRLDELGISYDSCPGVSSFSGAAAALNLEYTLPDVSQSVVITRMEGRTPVPEKEKVRSFAGHQSTMVLFLSAGLLKELEAELLAGGYAPETPAAIVYKATWPEEECHICTVGTLADTAAAHQITKTALIIVGDVVRCRHYSRSRLYDPTFTTEYRKGSQ